MILDGEKSIIIEHLMPVARIEDEAACIRGEEIFAVTPQLAASFGKQPDNIILQKTV